MRALFNTILARSVGFFRSRSLDSDFDHELETHISLAEEDKVRHGMTPEDARRAALVELGGLTQLREAGRAARGLAWLDGLGLDVKLGVRMLRKYWGLTLVGGLAMTTGIAILLVIWNTHHVIYGSTLPLEEGQRIVALMTWNSSANRRQGISLEDFVRWRSLVRSVVDVGAFRTDERALDMGGGGPETVDVAAMTAAGFDVTRVHPLIGRFLTRADELRDADPVVVIGYEVWSSRFASDRGVLGRTIDLDGVPHAIVGVMPSGFAFPVNHRFWVALRTEAVDYQTNGGSEVLAFGRLAANVSIEAADAELGAIGLIPTPPGQTSSEDQLTARVLPYANGMVTLQEGNDSLLGGMFLVILGLLLVPPGANIAILIYARNAARQTEFTARYALGAGRGRIALQLFIEILLLAFGAAGAALLIVRLLGRHIQTSVNLPNGMPFWLDFTIVAPQTVAVAVGLALAFALIAGIVPAVSCTGRLAESSGLRMTGTGSDLQLGGVWSLLLVVQIALSIAVVPVAVELAWGLIEPGLKSDTDWDASRFLTARLQENTPADPSAQPDVSASGGSDLVSLRSTLASLLSSEPGILGVSFSAALPGGEPRATFEVQDGEGKRRTGVSASNYVDESFFDVLDAFLLAGRTFEEGDFNSAQPPVIVSRAFVEELLGAGDPLSSSVRLLTGGASSDSPTTWHQIIGVVEEIPTSAGVGQVYYPLSRLQGRSVNLILKTRRDLSAVGWRVRELTLGAGLRADRIVSLEELQRNARRGRYIAGLMLAGITLSVLLLAAAGVYALMSFTVVRRRKEIGIRSALGASPRRLITGIFRRALVQITAGGAIGVLISSILDPILRIEVIGGLHVPGALVFAVAVMSATAFLAAAGPARRALAIQPVDALRDD